MSSSAIAELQAQDVRLRSLRDRVAAELDEDPGHDVAHALRVATWMLKLEPGLEPREVLAAALMHDIVNLPKDHPDRAKASAMSADVARSWLPDYGFSLDRIEVIATAVRDHSFSAGHVPTSALGRALQDADRLESLGALGLCRVLSTGARLGSAYFHPTDPFAERRALDDKAYSVDHFFAKLFKLEETMQTEAGRQEARKRSAFLRSFLDQLGSELGQPAP